MTDTTPTELHVELPASPPAPNPLALLQTAVDRGTDVATVERLLALYERWERKDAERALSAALSRFHGQCPAIPHDRENTHLRTTYASFDQIMTTIAPVLASCGLTPRFNAVTEDGSMTITCTVSHADGASLEATQRIPLGQPGKAVNPAQHAILSQKYGMRAAIVMALSLRTGDFDDDGEGAHQETLIDDAKAEELSVRAQALDIVEPFLEWLGVPSFDQLPERLLAKAERGLKAKEGA